MRLRRRRDRGFTFVELLVSLALSMVGLLGLMSLQMVAVRGNGASRNFTEATALAVERLEAMQALPFASVTAPPADTNPMGAISATYSPAAWKIYTRTTTVTTPVAGQANILVDVSWSDPYLPGATHHVKLNSVRTP